MGQGLISKKNNGHNSNGATDSTVNEAENRMAMEQVMVEQVMRVGRTIVEQAARGTGGYETAVVDEKQLMAKKQVMQGK